MCTFKISIIHLIGANIFINNKKLKMICNKQNNHVIRDWIMIIPDFKSFLTLPFPTRDETKYNYYLFSVNDICLKFYINDFKRSK